MTIKAATVGQLRAALAAFPDDLLVMVAKDAEGNGFEFVDEAVEMLCNGVQTWHTPEQWAAELANPDTRFDPEQDEPPEVGEQTGDGVVRHVVMLWP